MGDEMREMKFRCWDSDNNRWIDEEGNAIRAVFTLENKTYLKWTQWTGLKDSKGVEIYESDIVKFQISENFTGPINSIKEVAKIYIGSIEWDSEDAGFFILNTDDKWPHVKTFFAENIEVIGNIYEHKHLL